MSHFSSQEQEERDIVFKDKVWIIKNYIFDDSLNDSILLDQSEWVLQLKWIFSMRVGNKIKIITRPRIKSCLCQRICNFEIQTLNLWWPQTSVYDGHKLMSKITTMWPKRFSRPWKKIDNKQGCVFPMVIWPAFRMEKYRVNDHPYHAPQFIRFGRIISFWPFQN